MHNADRRNPYLDKPLDELERAMRSYEKLLQEHQEKLEAFKADPMKFDDGRMANATPEVRQKMIEGRIKALEKQMKKQQINLDYILKALEGCQK